MSEGVLTTGVVIRRRATTEWMARGGWFLFFLWRLLRCRRGILSHPQERPATHAAAGAAARGALIFCFWGALLPFVLRVVAGACVGRRTGQPRMPPQERLHEEFRGLGVAPVSGGVLTTGVVIRRRAASGEDGTRGLVYSPPPSSAFANLSRAARTSGGASAKFFSAACANVSRQPGLQKPTIFPRHSVSPFATIPRPENGQS